MKKIGDVTVNDGNGLMDNEGMCDSLILDCNNSVKALASGNYVQFCNVIVQMVQKISNLKNGIKVDTNALKANIEELKKMNISLAEQIAGLPVEKDGANNGTD